MKYRVLAKTDKDSVVYLDGLEVEQPYIDLGEWEGESEEEVTNKVIKSYRHDYRDHVDDQAEDEREGVFRNIVFKLIRC